jgi:arabinose-5-phosphate isomerase
MESIGEQVVRIEARALQSLADRLSGSMAAAFSRALDLILGVSGRVVVTGMGKSGIIARKITATLNSTGTPSVFMHPAEAVHGDLGMLMKGDVVIALSASGETAEILQLLPALKRLQIPLIAMTGDKIVSPNQSSKRSTLASTAEVSLDCSVDEEACALGLAPTASTATMLALGDALAVAVSHRRGFKQEDFAQLHPGGKLGKRLARVDALMHKGDSIPRVSPNTKMPDVIYEMSRKKLGIAAIVEEDRILGIISDGDLRRMLETRGKDVLDLLAGQCMTHSPKTITQDQFAATALALMEERKITSLLVIDDHQKLVGVVHLHDLWGAGL